MALSTQFDPIFRQHGDGIPVAFLRALAQRESGMNPRANAGQAAAQGLLQIVGVARDGYNQRHGTAYTRDDTLDPVVNVRIAVDLLKTIIRAYGKHPSKVLHADWASPEFVKLLVAGWNAGYSEGGGVGKVASYLEQRSKPVTHATVVANAGAAGATANLGNANRAAWHRSVADLYMDQPDRPRGIPLAGIAVAILASVLGYRLLT